MRFTELYLFITCEGGSAGEMLFLPRKRNSWLWVTAMAPCLGSCWSAGLGLCSARLRRGRLHAESLGTGRGSLLLPRVCGEGVSVWRGWEFPPGLCWAGGRETLAAVAGLGLGLVEPPCPSEKDPAGEMGELCGLTPALVKYFFEEKLDGILSSWETVVLGARLLQEIILIYSPCLQAGKELQTQG